MYFCLENSRQLDSLPRLAQRVHEYAEVEPNLLRLRRDIVIENRDFMFIFFYFDVNEPHSNTGSISCRMAVSLHGASIGDQSDDFSCRLRMCDFG